MRKTTIVSTLAILAQFAIIQLAFADTRYVSDQLIITLRPGKSTEHRIIKTLKSGTPLEVLEEDKTYLKVRTADGAEGYVLRQYVTSEPPKIQRIKELEEYNSSLEEKIRNLEEIRDKIETQLETFQENYKQELSAASTTSAELEQKLEQALTNERTMTEKYDTLLTQAGNVVEITAERDLLSQQNEKLKADTADLINRNDKLADARMIKWFLAGGSVFFLGWIIGKISRKKRSRF